MPTASDSLMTVFEGWDGYHQSIVEAVSPLTREQLQWRPASDLRSVGELVRHIALGRLDWFLRMDAPGSAEFARRVTAWEHAPQWNRYVNEEAVAGPDEAAALVQVLDASWQMVDATLKTWRVADLGEGYRHAYRGKTYAVSRQWTLWRIMAHDLHHGGELALMLGIQGIECFSLGALGGHIIEPPLAKQP
jgi:uncharacterized damage-inducible protein DinB